MTREEIISKIDKLLRLSTSDNVNESYAALSMARKLMSKYHVDESEIHDDSDNVIEKRVCFEFTERWNKWVIHLGGTICRNNRCRLLLNFTGKYKRQLSVVGESTDVEYVIKVIEYAHSVITSGINSRWYDWKDLGLRRDELTQYSDSYAFGYISSLNQYYKDQERSGEVNTLMVIIPDTVNKYVESMNLESHSREESITVERFAFEDGMNDGKDFFNRSQLSEGNMRYIGGC